MDQVRGPLWENLHSSYNGINDRVPIDTANLLDRSLYFIQPNSFKISVGIEGAEFGNPRRRVRGLFKLNGNPYKLSVTDPDIVDRFHQAKSGTYQIEDALLCVSLGEPWDGHAYNLIASVITQDRSESNS